MVDHIEEDQEVQYEDGHKANPSPLIYQTQMTNWHAQKPRINVLKTTMNIKALRCKGETPNDNRPGS